MGFRSGLMLIIVLGLLTSFAMGIVSVPSSNAQTDRERAEEAFKELDREVEKLRGEKPKKEIDEVAVTIKLELRGEQPKKTGDEGTAVITLTPNVDMESLLFSVSLAGGGRADPPSGFESIKPIQPYIKELKPSSHFQRRLFDLKANRPESFSVKFRMVEEGYGYIMGSVRAPAEGTAVVFSESSVLFFLASGTEAYFSHHSIADLDAQKLERDLTRKGLPREDIQEQIRRLRRSGARVEVRPAATCFTAAELAREIDKVAVAIKLELTGELPGKVGDAGAVAITLTPNMDVKDLLFSVSFAGGGRADPPDGFEIANPIQPYIRELKAGSHFQRKVFDLKADQPESFSVKFKMAEEGYGYIMGSVRAPAEGKPVLFSESSVLFFFASRAEVYFSYHSILDLDTQKLERDLIRKQLSEEDIQKQIRKLKRGGAKVEKRSSPGKAGAGNRNEEQSYNSVTANGTIRFTDRVGGTHPVTFVTVQIWDEEAGADELVATTTTDANGDYSVTFDDNDGDGTGRDVYVVVRAEGTTVQVEDFGADYYTATGDVWEVDSGAPMMDVIDGSTLTINITATNNDASPQNVAFEAYEAVNLLSRYLTDLGEPLPALVIVRYPRTGTDGSNYSPTNSWIRLSGTDVHDWDNIQHEYGHHIQNIYGTANNPGGTHYFDASMCSYLGKDGGVRIAWAEGWPTFFGTMAQAEMGLNAMGIPDLGDTSYTDTKPNPADNINYDLEAFDAWSMGEGNETAVQRVLWDMYDGVDDAGDTGVSMSPQHLWDVIEDNQPHTFSDFWNDITALHTEAEKVAFGAICAQHNIAAEITAPANGTVFAGGALPTFQWTGNVTCDTGGNARYSVRFYNNDITSLIWASPWQSGSTFTPTNDQRDLIFVGPDGNIQWTVASKDLSVPETGVYYGNSRTIVDDFDVPDRNPVDIILALDLSGSMGGGVPGSDTSLTKLQLLQQAVEIFVRTWAVHAIDGDRIGVVYFSTNTSSMPATPPILVDVAANADAIVADVLSKTDGGCTAIGGALQVGYDNIENGDNKKVIILFSDGEQTINPFVDEEGTPAKLKIRVIPSGSTLPFDAYWCATFTATAPDGTTIVPDGDFLYEHDIEVHTIGVGVNGASFEDLIERISDETDALHHFTSAPDEELDIFYTNDLINSLKTGTLEIVKTDKGTLTRGGTKTLSVPVNKVARSLTIVLSWKGELREDALTLRVNAPDGSILIPSEVSRGDFFNVSKFTFPPRSRRREVAHWGNWTVRIYSQTEVDSVKYQFTAIVDEPCFHFDFAFPRRDYGTGDPITLTATLTQNGRPLPGAGGVWANVTSPAYPIGNILSNCLPQVKLGDIRQYRRDDKRELYPRRFDAMLAALLADPGVASLTRARSTSRIRLYDDGRKEHGDVKAGDGIYSNTFTTTQVPGNYEFRLHILASSACGKVARTESASTLVSINTFSPNNSIIKAVPMGKDLYAITVRPVDDYGNLLGPGNERFMKIFTTSGKLDGAVIDRFDGSYEQVIQVKPGDNPKISIQIKGKQVFHIPLLTLVSIGKQ